MSTEMKPTREQVAVEIESGINQFTGTEQYFRHWSNALVYTEGVQWIAEKAGAYWLIDLVASWQHKKVVREQPFQLWILKVNRKAKKYMARASCFTDSPKPDNSNRLCFQNIHYTDFPLDEFKLLLCDGVLMLPREY